MIAIASMITAIAQPIPGARSTRADTSGAPPRRATRASAAMFSRRIGTSVAALRSSTTMERALRLSRSTRESTSCLWA